MRRFVLVLGLAACGFTPNQAPADASHDPDASHLIDAREFHDAHVFDDAHVFMDAMTPPVFDPTLCPSDYSNNSITSSPNTRYRIIPDMHGFVAQNADCNDDHPGWTHLFVIDSITEAQQIKSHLGQPYYVGAVQPRDSSGAAIGWLAFTGAAVDPSFWQGGQPNDNDFTPFENNDQNFAAADDTTGLLNDVSGSFQYQAVCECDGLPVSTAAAQAIAGN
jgi:hypothetical protein